MSGRPTHRVVVVGGGFAGLQAVRGLRRAPVEVTLVDRQNFTLFQPLVYQVATGALSPGRDRDAAARDPAPAAQRARRARRGDRVRPRPARGRRRPPADGGGPPALGYDTLVVAGGSRYSYFGHDEWRAHAPELKSLDGALDIRSRILAAFEAAEVEPDPERRASWLTFVVVGAGPTGVEMAGQIAELARDTLRRDFRCDRHAHGARPARRGGRPRLPASPSRSRGRRRARSNGSASRRSSRTRSSTSTADSVAIEAATARVEQVDARTAIWAAGVTASELAAQLADGGGRRVDRAGRVTVEPDLTLPGHPEVFALGDMVRVAPRRHERRCRASRRSRCSRAATPRARSRAASAAANARRSATSTRATSPRSAGRRPSPTSRASTSPASPPGRSGSGVHLFYLIGFQNRLLVLLRWTISFVTRGRGARLITVAPAADRPSMSVAGSE